jgi:hypothetical protein
MSSRGATSCHLQTHLLGQEGLPPPEDTRDCQATLLPPVVELLPGHPLTMAPPQEGSRQAGGLGRYALRQRQDLGQAP